MNHHFCLNSASDWSVIFTSSRCLKIASLYSLISLVSLSNSVWYMEPDESIDLVDSEAGNAYGSVFDKEEHENPCKYIPRKVKMLIHHVFIHTSIFFRWNLPSLLNRPKCQLIMKFPARGEELTLERVVEVVVHAKQQIKIVTQTVSVADVPAMKWLNIRRPDTVFE